MSPSRQLKLRDGRDRLEETHHVFLDDQGVVAAIVPGRFAIVFDGRVGKTVGHWNIATLAGGHHRNIPGRRITLDDQKPQQHHRNLFRTHE